jgi:DNA invertase Pin-like site-specific DNA recombinase
MPRATAAAAYARISSDQEGTGLGVRRQLEDCRKLAAELGWMIAEEYVDNDLSAYNGKPRPAYERMLADLADGTRDAVLVAHLDRLTRRPKELEQFLDVVTAAKVRHVRFVTGGDLDIANGDGLMVVRMLAAVAANESATKSRRVRRKLDQRAHDGLPHGGYRRPYGYEDDKTTIRPPEAAVVRTLAERFLAGESLRSLATWLNQQGIRTVAGGQWQTPTLRAMLASGRIAGLREHRGEVVGAAAWPRIISEETRRRIQARFDDKVVSGRRAPRNYLLSGLLRCGRCANTIFSARRGMTRRYVCMSGPDHGGCGRLSVVASPVEDLIVDAVLYRLDTPELADALAGRTARDERVAAVAESLSRDREQFDELARLYGSTQISAREWLAARRPIEDRIRSAERLLASQSRGDALAGVVGQADRLRASWAELNLSRRHAIVSAVLDHAVIGPGTRGAQVFDPERVVPLWRL